LRAAGCDQRHINHRQTDPSPPQAEYQTYIHRHDSINRRNHQPEPRSKHQFHGKLILLSLRHGNWYRQLCVQRRHRWVRNVCFTRKQALARDQSTSHKQVYVNQTANIRPQQNQSLCERSRRQREHGLSSPQWCQTLRNVTKHHTRTATRMAEHNSNDSKKIIIAT
jgi:hypothetical protein